MSFLYVPHAGPKEHNVVRQRRVEVAVKLLFRSIFAGTSSSFIMPAILFFIIWILKFERGGKVVRLNWMNKTTTITLLYAAENKHQDCMGVHACVVGACVDG